jgi:hypothetical protein
MTEPKPHVGKVIGGHLFTVDEKYCSIYYRGIVAKETDKSFRIEAKNWPGGSLKVLKAKHYVVAPPDVEPAYVLNAFEAVKKSFAAGVRDLEGKLAAERARQFNSSMTALYHAAEATPEAEEIGTTSTG